MIFPFSTMYSLLQEMTMTDRFVIFSTCERCLLVFYSLMLQTQEPKMLMKMEMQRCIQRLYRYTIRDLPKKLGFFAVFTFKIELWIVLNSNNENIMRRKKMDRLE